MKESEVEKSRREYLKKSSVMSRDQMVLMVQLHKKILVFRDILDLPPSRTPASLHQVHTHIYACMYYIIVYVYCAYIYSI